MLTIIFVVSLNYPALISLVIYAVHKITRMHCNDIVYTMYIKIHIISYWKNTFLTDFIFTLILCRFIDYQSSEVSEVLYPFITSLINGHKIQYRKILWIGFVSFSQNLSKGLENFCVALCYTKMFIAYGWTFADRDGISLYWFL